MLYLSVIIECLVLAGAGVMDQPRRLLRLDLILASGQRRTLVMVVVMGVIVIVVVVFLEQIILLRLRHRIDLSLTG